jgi:hypothetical protein
VSQIPQGGTFNLENKPVNFFLRRDQSMDCSIHVLFPAFFPSLLKVLSGRSAFSKALLDARHASLHSRFQAKAFRLYIQAHAVRLYIRVFVEGRRIVFHSASKKE